MVHRSQRSNGSLNARIPHYHHYHHTTTPHLYLHLSPSLGVRGGGYKGKPPHAMFQDSHLIDGFCTPFHRGVVCSAILRVAERTSKGRERERERERERGKKKKKKKKAGPLAGRCLPLIGLIRAVQTEQPLWARGRLSGLNWPALPRPSPLPRRLAETARWAERGKPGALLLLAVCDAIRDSHV
ncbi:hypothetical protein LY78DRAFT_352561 [Colletotrichum sublineola]|nr:hypothetical protein LY78DRAFT_352561 [Colletotrichum sublineola]